MLTMWKYAYYVSYKYKTICPFIFLSLKYFINHPFINVHPMLHLLSCFYEAVKSHLLSVKQVLQLYSSEKTTLQNDKIPNVNTEYS